MLKQFIKDSFIYSTSKILSRAISILLVPIYTRILMPADYGAIDMLTVFNSFINLVIALEISQGFARYFADADNVKEKKEYFSSALWFTVFAYVVFFLVAVVFSEALSIVVLSSGQLKKIFLVASVFISLNGIFNFMQGQLRWQLKAKEYFISSLVYLLTNVFFSIYFVVFMKVGVIGVFYGKIIGCLLSLILVWSYSKDTYSFLFVWSKCKKMLKFSLPLVPSSLAIFITLYIDRMAIKTLLGLSSVGLYGIGYRVASVVGILMVGVQVALTPLIYTHYKEKNTPEDIAIIFNYFIALSLVFFMGLSLFSKEILIIFTVPAYYKGSVLVPILLPAIIFTGLYNFAPGLALEKKTKIIAGINVFMAVINFILNILLIPLFGLIGAASATLLSSFICFIMYIFWGNKYYPIPYAWRKLLTSCIVAVLIVICISLVDCTLINYLLLKSIMLIIGIVFVCFSLLDKRILSRF